MSLDPKTERRFKRLEANFEEQLKVYVQNDEELRKKINDQRITMQAAVGAIEMSIAHRLAVTLDVVMNMLPKEVHPAALAEIERRVAEIPDTAEIARRYASKKYQEGEGDKY
jgi:hypothetical protein